MHNSLESLLHSSAQAARQGRTVDSWRIMHRYATEFWLEEPVDPLGEFYALRAAVADCLGMVDEAVGALQEMHAWGERHDPPVALIAQAHLAYQSLNNSDPLLSDAPGGVTAPLPDAEMLLDQLATALESYLAPFEAGEVDKRTAGQLVLAATTGYTVASNCPDAARAPRFANLVRTFGTRAPSEVDRQLWFAQEHWTNGRRAEARALAEQILQDFPDNVIARFEAYDMRAHFDLMESLEDYQDRPGIARNWVACAEISLTMGAPLLALRRSELACRALMGEGKLAEAADLAARMRQAMEGAPISPALLDLTAVNAEAAFELGEFSEALRLAQGTAEWCELNGDIESAVQCYSIAALSCMQLGADDEHAVVSEQAIELQVRRAGLLARMNNHMTAAQAYLALALAADETHYLDTAWEILGKDPQHPDYLWVLAEARLTAAAVYVNQGDVASADREIALAEELIQSLPESEDLAAELEYLKQRRG